MALTVTSAANAIAIGDRYVKLTAFTNPSQGAISSPTYLVVDNETMLVTDTSLSPTLGVARGMEPMGVAGGAKASAHNSLAPLIYGLASDFTQATSTNQVAGLGHWSISVNGTYTMPVTPCTIYITKAGVCAITINAPNNDQNNQITVVSLTANAHTITYTAGFYQNTTSSDVVTFPSTSGACWIFQAKNGLWNATLGGGTTGGVTGPA